MKKTEPVRKINWKSIEPLSSSNYSVSEATLVALNSLQHFWLENFNRLKEPERAQIRQRTLRRLSIETGLIERLYDIEWGLTLTLVSEGFSRDVIERAGGKMDESTLATLVAQRDSLKMVLDFVHEHRKLSSAFVKELHAALTRTQSTYDAHDALGRPTKAPLHHGAWKLLPNHVLREDGSLLEYCPPIQVQDEMDRLLSLFEDLERSNSVHPIIRTAWLHHRFVQIHPFEDGNGRVARALSLLVLEKHKYAPLVIDRFHRGEYLRALDSANEADLRPLIALFTKLENAALAGELSEPTAVIPPQTSNQVLALVAEKLAKKQQERVANAIVALMNRGNLLFTIIGEWFDRKLQETNAAFQAQGISGFWADCSYGAHDDAKRNFWFRRQIIDSAHRASHFAEFSNFSAWYAIRISVDETQLRFIASIHGAGKEPGVLAVTTFAETGQPEGRTVESVGKDTVGWNFIETGNDAFLVAQDSSDEISSRKPELYALLDESFTLAMTHLARGL